jgi:hypothetical protein
VDKMQGDTNAGNGDRPRYRLSPACRCHSLALVNNSVVWEVGGDGRRRSGKTTATSSYLHLVLFASAAD